MGNTDRLTEQRRKISFILTSSHPLHPKARSSSGSSCFPRLGQNFQEDFQSTIQRCTFAWINFERAVFCRDSTETNEYQQFLSNSAQRHHLQNINTELVKDFGPWIVSTAAHCKVCVCSVCLQWPLPYAVTH